MAINATKIHDYDKKIDIWKKPMGYSEDSKLDFMDIDYKANRFDATVQYARAIVSEKFKDVKRLADTFTYLYEIKSGYEKETFEDIPYIIPYVIKDSKYSVIILSGGGFAYKTIHGGVNGGKKVAIELNKKGISAFLLSYRSNPYKFPIPMLDLQRSIRYIRYNAKSFGINPKNITVLGYSAGGYVLSSFINKYMGKNNFDDTYVEDEIDKTDDTIYSAGFIYSPMSFKYNVPMLYAVCDTEDIDTKEKREEILQKLDMSKQFDSSHIPQFISYSNSDLTVDYRSVEGYIKKAKEKGTNITRIFVPNEDHGYDESFFMEDYIKWLEWI